jgi:hypothetical protein
MRHVIIASVAVGLSAPCILAQAFNIDISVGSPIPSSSYGAASGQAGHWDNYILPPMALTDITNTLTSVTISGTGGGPAGGNDPLTTGDDDALLDDFLAIPFAETYTVNGLAAGTYSIYGYVWTFSPLPTGVDVNGQGMQVVGGTWTGSFIPGSYSLHTVTLAPSQPLVIHISTINGALGAFAGLQIVPVPTPGAAALLGCAALAGAKRRRR